VLARARGWQSAVAARSARKPGQGSARWPVTGSTRSTGSPIDRPSPTSPPLVPKNPAGRSTPGAGPRGRIELGTG
jgi:hypothetical protein